VVEDGIVVVETAEAGRVVEKWWWWWWKPWRQEGKGGGKVAVVETVAAGREGWRCGIQGRKGGSWRGEVCVCVCVCVLKTLLIEATENRFLKNRPSREMVPPGEGQGWSNASI